jgi:hypothetical protein
MYRGEEISSLEEAVAIMGSCSNAGKLHSVIPVLYAFTGTVRRDGWLFMGVHGSRTSLRCDVQIPS